MFVIVQEIKVNNTFFKVKTANLDVNNALKKYNKFFKEVLIKDSYLLVKSEDILNKCILIFIDGKVYLTPLVDFSTFD